MKGKLLFEEKHGLRGTWSWYLVIVSSILMGWVFGQQMYQQLILGIPDGDQPMSDTGLLLVSIGSLLLIFGVCYLIDATRLHLKIDEGTISYSFRPFVNKIRTLDKHDLNAVTVRKYKPIVEYGGWGFRSMMRKKKAYNIKGNWGLQLEFQDGRSLLLGTQRPDDLKDAIDTLKRNWQMS